MAAAFRHRTSRAGDPQLHTHVLVANLGRGLDGRWSALDGRRLYAHARAASFVYQAVLRAELTRTLGRRVAPVRNGIAEVVGVPQAGAAGVQPAARGDRGGARASAGRRARARPRRRRWRRAGRRTTLVGVDELVSGVAGARGRAGVRPRRARSGCSAASRRRSWTPRDGSGCSTSSRSPAGLTRRASTFSRRDVIQALCERVPAGARSTRARSKQRRTGSSRPARAVALLPDA